MSISLILTTALLVTINLGQTGCTGKKFETWEVKNGNQRIVVTACREQFRYNPGAIYEFEFIGESGRSSIMSFRHDDPVPINKEGVVFLNEDVIYVYMGWKYAISTDGGGTWDTWNGEYALADWECCNYYLIDKVEMDETGKGSMSLSESRTMPARIMVTNDYGKSWTEGSPDNSEK